MSRAGTVALVILTALHLGAASTATADEPLTQVERLVLALDGTPVAVSAGDIITIEGTLTSTHDGSEIDAFSRRTDGLDFVDAGPFIDVPEGSELIEADAESHRYVVRVGEDGAVAFAVQRLAMSQLVTRSVAASRLRGAFELARPVAVEAPLAVASSAVEEREGAPLWPLGALLGIGAVVIPLSRRRRSSFAPLLRRARRAQKAVALEVVRLGPAFEPIVDSAARLAATVTSLRDHVQETKSARARIRGAGPEAAAKRLALTKEAGGSLERAVQIVDRLEGIAAKLAVAVADHARATDVDEALALANADLDLALDADAIARAM